jgi:hypothetical protein
MNAFFEQVKDIAPVLSFLAGCVTVLILDYAFELAWRVKEAFQNRRNR